MDRKRIFTQPQRWADKSEESKRIMVL